MKKIVALLAIALVLSGCSDAKETVENQTANDVSTTDSLDDSFYRVVNFNTNLSREDYYTAFGNTIFKQLDENYRFYLLIISQLMIIICLKGNILKRMI